jgi:predicted nucleic acid-binding protein
MDEERGREIARQQGLTVRGSLGTFIEAYREQLISLEQLRFYFAEISSRTDIWISPALCRRLLEHIS